MLSSIGTDHWIILNMKKWCAAPFNGGIPLVNMKTETRKNRNSKKEKEIQE